MFKNNTGVDSILFILFITLVEFIGSTIIIYLITFTFGASLIESFYETTLFSMLISLECFMPLFICCEHSNPFDLLNRLFIKKDFKCHLESLLVNIAHGGVIGAWLGALVIPLDWDRWWQVWPISCCISSLIGTILGGLLFSISFKNKNKLHL
jgi:phosphatidylinositol glycan class F